MALQFILGGSGSGKSTALYERVIRQSVEKADNKILLIVPEQYTMQTQRQIVDKHPAHGVMNVDILSFERLAYRVFEELGTKIGTVLDDTGKTMIVRRLLGQHQEELTSIRGNVRKQGFAAEMKSVISEFLQYDISPAGLVEKLGDLGAENRLFGKLKDIHTIYTAFESYLGDHYITKEEILDKLCDVIDQADCVRNTTIFMDNFTGFTPIQYKLMEHLLLLSEDMIIALPADPLKDTYVDQGQEELFHLTKETIFKLEKICKEHHIPRASDLLLQDAEAGRYKGNHPLGYLERSLYRNSITPYRGDCHHVSVTAARHPLSEMQFVASEIHHLVAEKGYHYGEIAVIASDMAAYLRHARHWFDRYEIPCFFDERRDITGNMLVVWLKSLLEMMDKDFSYASVMAYLRCPLSGADREETDLLENYMLAFGIRGFRRWSKTWTAKDRDMEEDVLIRLNEWRAALVLQMTGLYEICHRQDATIHELIVAIYQVMAGIGMKKRILAWKEDFESRGDAARAREYEQIYDVIIGLFEKTDRILGTEQVSVRELSDILNAGIAEEKIGIIPPGFDQVTFGDIKRTRMDNMKVIFFAGMNSGLVPASPDSRGLITDYEKEELAEMDIQMAPTAKQKLCAEQYYLYASLTKASDLLYISYSRADMDGKDREASDLLRSIFRILSGLTVHDYREDCFDRSRADLHAAIHLLSEGLRKISDGQEPPEEFKPVFDWFYTHPDYQEMTMQMVEAAFFCYVETPLSKAAVEQIYHGQLMGSVTMLEQYAACAYAHFLNYGLKLKERQIYQLQAVDFGQIYHLAIERFSKRVDRSGYSWRDMPDDVRDAMVHECVQSVAMEYNHAIMKDTMKNSFMIDKIDRIARETVWALTQQIRKGDFDPVGYEVAFSAEMDSENMRIVCGEAGVLSMRGKIDRMDLYEQDGKTYVKIVDYKSGKTDFDLSKVYHGLQLQLVVYMNAAGEELKKKKGKQMVIPAGILYYHIDDPLVEADSYQSLVAEPMPGADYSSDEIARLKELSMNGLVVADPEIVSHMDRDLSQPPKTIPVEVKKDGSFSARSSVALPDHFELLQYHAREKSKALAQQIFRGEIAVKPYQYKGQSPCTYCNYRKMCAFDPTVRGYHYNRMKKMKDEEIWLEMSKGGGKA